MIAEKKDTATDDGEYTRARLDRIRRLTELADLPRETVTLPSLPRAVEGRSIPSVDEPPPPRPLPAAIGSRPRSAW